MTLYEIIDSLIDLTGVPVTDRKGEKYEAARNLIHAELSSVEDVEVACHHEAGHWAQAVLVAHQLGIDDPSLFRVVGPQIRYIPSEDNPYDATPTGLRMCGMENWRPQIEQHVKLMARIAVAGGESVGIFYGPKQKRGDLNDLKRFELFCKGARMHLGGIIQPPHSYQTEAVEEVRKDFDDEHFKSLVQSKAKLIKKEQFGPVFGFQT